jgi:Mn2+/Fe2+ NRAMP family transporter
MVKLKKEGQIPTAPNRGNLKEEIIFSFEVKTIDETIVAKVSGLNLLGLLKRFWGFIVVISIMILVITGQITIEQLEKILNLVKAF